MRRIVAAAVVSAALALAASGCAQETALARFCGNYDRGASLLTTNDHQDLAGFKAQYDKGVQSLATAANAAPTDIKVAVLRERDSAATVNNGVQTAQTMDELLVALAKDTRTDKAANAARIERWVEVHCDVNT